MESQRQRALISQNSKINKRLERVEDKLDKVLDKLDKTWTVI